MAIAAALAAAVLGALMAAALRGETARFARPLAAAIASGAVLVGLALNASVVSAPDGLTAAISVSNVRDVKIAHRGETHTVGEVNVRLSDPDLARDGIWAYVLAWQGNGRVHAKLIEQADGSFRSAGPIPIGGDWKSFVRLHKGRTEVAAAVRMPGDEAIDFAGFPAPTSGAAVRPMVRDTELLQIERKPDGPYWAWKPAFIFVIAFDLSLFVLMGFICVRLGRSQRQPPRHRERAGTSVGGAVVAA